MQPFFVRIPQDQLSRARFLSHVHIFHRLLSRLPVSSLIGRQFPVRAENPHSWMMWVTSGVDGRAMTNGSAAHLDATARPRTSAALTWGPPAAPVPSPALHCRCDALAFGFSAMWWMFRTACTCKLQIAWRARDHCSVRATISPAPGRDCAIHYNKT